MEKAELDADEASKQVEEKLKKLQAAALSNAGAETVKRLNAEALSAKDVSVKAVRKAAKWAAKASNFRAELEKQGEIIPED